MNRNLVITRAGARSLHEMWLQPVAARNFDLLIASYSPQLRCPDASGVTLIDVPGPKVRGWRSVMSDRPEIFDRYDRIALIDDDIGCTAADISRCFDIGAEFRLSIWQPSLSWASYFTYAGTLRNPLFRLRHVNYVEMMCPFFTAAALRAVSPLMDYGWETGIDLIWCSILERSTARYAVIDEIAVHHTRPVGRERSGNGFAGRTYEDEIYPCLDHFGMRWPSLVSDAAILADGNPVSRLGVNLRVPAILGALRRTPNERAPRLLSDHIRHQWTRDPLFGGDVAAVIARDRREGRLPAVEPG